MVPEADASTPNEAANAALDWVRKGMTLGLGSGRAAEAFVRALSVRVADGLQIVGVPTSQATADLARRLGIPLARIDEVEGLDISFDGADEVDDQLDLIKGYGGAMLREKIVAASSNQLVILVGPEKLVRHLGERGRLPIEILPFGETVVRRALGKLGLDTIRRVDERSETVVTDNGNWILDVKLYPPFEADRLEAAITAIPGVLGTGFFLGMADAVIIGREGGVDIRRAQRPEAP